MLSTSLTIGDSSFDSEGGLSETCFESADGFLRPTPPASTWNAPITLDSSLKAGSCWPSSSKVRFVRDMDAREEASLHFNLASLATAERLTTGKPNEERAADGAVNAVTNEELGDNSPAFQLSTLSCVFCDWLANDGATFARSFPFSWFRRSDVLRSHSSHSSSVSASIHGMSSPCSQLLCAGCLVAHPSFVVRSLQKSVMFRPSRTAFSMSDCNFAERSWEPGERGAEDGHSS